MPIIYRCDRCGEESETFERDDNCYELIFCEDCTKKFKLGYKALRINHAAEHKKFKEDFLNEK